MLRIQNLLKIKIDQDLIISKVKDKCLPSDNKEMRRM